MADDGVHNRENDTQQAKPISQLGYEECRDELIDVVRLLEQGGLGLDASLELWERGEELAKRCEEHLAGARKRVADALAPGESADC
ncbi:MAG: exodeoxyribonuclease VII small subunit [Mycobacterium sp.]|nr:exodeoxyribonuclease VII small subunit [Mycobacterium sp.]